MTIQSEPNDEGFYWWRINPCDEWRMVRVKKFGDFLTAYDIHHNEWGGRTIEVWKAREPETPIGQWIAINQPASWI